MKRRSVFLAGHIWDRLTKLGEKKGMNVSELIRLAVFEFLQREER